MKKEKAYTLMEIMIAALFIGLALITIAAAFTNSSHILQKSRHTLTALGYLQAYEELIRNKAFSSISSVSYALSSAPLTNANISITAETIYSDLKKVSLDIYWNEAGKTTHKKTVTLVTEKGINPD
jgi:type II secretory pathway pseudopilin PulG